MHVEPCAKAKMNDGSVSQKRGRLCLPRGCSEFLLLGKGRTMWQHLMKDVGPPRNPQSSQGRLQDRPGNRSSKG